jgi:hypothetical protein
VVYRDVAYGVVVELDGRAGHANVGSQWRDMSRDNAAALKGKITLRFGYQLVTEPCATAAQVGLALRSRGWARLSDPLRIDLLSLSRIWDQVRELGSVGTSTA